MSQLSLPFPDAVVSALISPSTCTWRYDGLPATVAGASAEQLQRALELLPDEMRRGRGPGWNLRCASWRTNGRRED